MAVKNLWGSNGEERGFRSIESTWGDQYRIMAQMPLSALFTPDPEWCDTSHLFFKTSVDYVVCDEQGHLLLAIDYDGLGGGFDDSMGRYVPAWEIDGRRKLNFNFKLKYARRDENQFPYHIVASPEFRPVAPGIDLTIVDAMIGNILARREFFNLFSTTSFTKIGELALACDINNNKILQHTLDLFLEIHNLTGRWPPGLGSVRWRAQAGGPREYFLHTDIGEVAAVVSIRDKADRSLEDGIGTLLVYDKLWRRLRDEAPQSFTGVVSGEFHRLTASGGAGPSARR